MDAPPDAVTSSPDAGSEASAIPCAAPTATPITIRDSITASTTWTCDNVYLVQGTVEVLSPATLTIGAGTTVLMSNDDLADGNLLVGPGAQLVAVGTPDQPIVFTSSAVGLGETPRAGDWGCVALDGLALGNWGALPDGGVLTYGSPDDANSFPGSTFPFLAGSGDSSHDADSSGTLEYVRMEYGGNVRNSMGAANHEMLGVYGAGSGTLLDYVDLRQGKLGCLFAEGGSFRARHLICQYGGESGGFDFTRGNQSRAQFLLIQENPSLSSEGIGFKGPSDVNQLPPLTSPTLYNVTACGTFGGTDPKDSVQLLHEASARRDSRELHRHRLSRWDRDDGGDGSQRRGDADGHDADAQLDPLRQLRSDGRCGHEIVTRSPPRATPTWSRGSTRPAGTTRPRTRIWSIARAPTHLARRPRRH